MKKYCTIYNDGVKYWLADTGNTIIEKDVNYILVLNKLAEKGWELFTFYLRHHEPYFIMVKETKNKGGLVHPIN